MAIVEQRRDEQEWAFVSGTFRALSHTFAFRASDEAFGRHLARVFRPLSTVEPAEHIYSLFDHGPGTSPRYVQFFDDDQILQSDIASQPLANMIWHVNYQVGTRPSPYILFHSSAAAFAGHALIFPASMESGKSTLVTGLVREGLGYLTDEAVALDPSTGNIVPYPRSISLNPGSWPLFPEYDPKLEPAIAELSPFQWHIDPDRVRAGASAAPSPPGLVIAPKYEKDSQTELIPFRRAEAIVTLLKNSFNFRTHGPGALEVVARAVERCRCYRLNIGDLGEACRLVIEAARELEGVPSGSAERKVLE